jgi:hypothetical protein
VVTVPVPDEVAQFTVVFGIGAPLASLTTIKRGSKEFCPGQKVQVSCPCPETIEIVCAEAASGIRKTMVAVAQSRDFSVDIKTS